jgi:hypothetical protein
MALFGIGRPFVEIVGQGQIVQRGNNDEKPKNDRNLQPSASQQPENDESRHTNCCQDANQVWFGRLRFSEAVRALRRFIWIHGPFLIIPARQITPSRN